MNTPTYNRPDRMKNPLTNQQGSYFVVSALVLVVMFAFSAFGMEVGRWYAIEGELDKAIDGASFAGAKNVSNPVFQGDNAALEAFVVQVAQANFPAGHLGTDTPNFTANLDANQKVTVTGSVHAMNNMVPVLDSSKDQTLVGSSGSAKLRKAEIAMVLDVSGSMAGTPIANLIDASVAFVENFESYESDHKMALINFATGVQIPFALDHDYVDDMTDAIEDFTANGGTNTEDALGQAKNLAWEPAQLNLPINERTRQILILFSDGNPSGFRGEFRQNGTDFEAVVLTHNGNPPQNVWGQFGKTNEQVHYYGSNADRLGDGESPGSSACAGTNPTTEWKIFNDPVYGINAYGQSPMTNYSAPYCEGEEPAGLVDYVNWLNKQMAIDHANELKNDIGIEIFTIGYGDIDQGFLNSLATDSEHAYFANNPEDLQGVFQEIANKLKLILIS